jgi:hypothetical protein
MGGHDAASLTTSTSRRAGLHHHSGPGMSLSIKSSQVKSIKCPSSDSTICKKRGELIWEVSSLQFIPHNPFVVGTTPPACWLCGFVSLLCVRHWCLNELLGLRHSLQSWVASTCSFVQARFNMMMRSTARAAAVATRAAVGSQPRRFYQAPQKDMDFVVNETYNHKHP